MSTLSSKLYLAGQMSGKPQFNFPAFDAAALHLRSLGYDIVSPAEMDSPEMRAFAMQSPDGDNSKLHETGLETWGQVLARDVQVVADQVDGVVVLPDWLNSRGARLEVFVAVLCGKPVYRYQQHAINVVSGAMDRDYILNEIADSFVA